MKRSLLLFFSAVLVCSFITVPALALESSNDPIYSLDLQDKPIGLLDDSNLTNKDWSTVTDASVSIKSENGAKFVNLYDNSSSVSTALHCKSLDFRSGIKTIYFELRANQIGSSALIFDFSDYASGNSFIRFEFGQTISYFPGSGSTSLGIESFMNAWVPVFFVIDAENSNYTCYYNSEPIVTGASTRSSASGTIKDQLLDLVFRTSTSVVGGDYDVGNITVYDGDVSAALLAGDLPAKPDAPAVPAPAPLSGVTDVFGSVAGWLAGQFGAAVSLFWNADTGSLTFLGVLSVCALVFSVIFLIIFICSRFLRFRS